MSSPVCPDVSSLSGQDGARSAAPRAASRKAGNSLQLVDLGKALASQLIVWHHLALYGPMCEVAETLAPELRAWLVDNGRLAVQVFLVMAGFLAARSMVPHPGAAPRGGSGNRWTDFVSSIGRRFWRLAEPYWVALLAALLAARAARSLIEHPTIPAEPTLLQWVANVLMVQDIAGLGALSAGVWYVAIDLQLFAMVALLGLLRQGWEGRGRTLLTACLVLAAVLSSLLVFNLDSSFDVWAIYFAGSYGMGMLAQWAVASRPGARVGWLLVLLALTGSALLAEWRVRILLAGLCALMLALLVPLQLQLPRRLAALSSWLSRISYAVFLLHYPVLLLTGAMVGAWLPETPAVHAAGLGLAWSLSLLAGWGLQAGLEAWARWRRQASSDDADQRAAVPG
ncbi:acyltransferase family protein [Sphaerotilus uruguayifluvii]|uniref:Peptidoglycan/LPS O-acetylase OafA/YrhL n=1 Tax=Sphaerotilus uruguayifluvii TaxID=2735897 RepID=A0ABX2FZG5_9BURK|nr:acyltransferase [Leptothrix sp. C29]NRT55423.1 peptidoglycan/LPS O-acetylase OafA/YrhL [Leptothrix sp. C29]